MHINFSLSSNANRIITMRKIRLEDFKLSWVHWWRWGCAYFCIYSCRRGMTGRAQRVTLWPRSWDGNHFHFRQRVWSIPVAKCEGCTRLPSRSRVDKREEPTESSVCTVRQSLRALTCRIFMLMIQSSANSAAAAGARQDQGQPPSKLNVRHCLVIHTEQDRSDLCHCRVLYNFKTSRTPQWDTREAATSDKNRWVGTTEDDWVDGKKPVKASKHGSSMKS